MPLHLTLNFEPDPNGVFDGRMIAQQLIGIAFEALVPYTGGCPGCTDALFSYIANGVIEELHERGRLEKGLAGRIYPPGITDEALERHLKQSEEVTRHSLELANVADHDH